MAGWPSGQLFDSIKKRRGGAPAADFTLLVDQQGFRIIEADLLKCTRKFCIDEWPNVRFLSTFDSCDGDNRQNQSGQPPRFYLFCLICFWGVGVRLPNLGLRRTCANK